MASSHFCADALPARIWGFTCFPCHRLKNLIQNQPDNVQKNVWISSNYLYKKPHTNARFATRQVRYLLLLAIVVVTRALAGAVPIEVLADKVGRAAGRDLEAVRRRRRVERRTVVGPHAEHARQCDAFVAPNLLLGRRAVVQRQRVGVHHPVVASERGKMPRLKIHTLVRGQNLTYFLNNKSTISFHYL